MGLAKRKAGEPVTHSGKAGSRDERRKKETALESTFIVVSLHRNDDGAVVVQILKDPLSHREYKIVKPDATAADLFKAICEAISKIKQVAPTYSELYYLYISNKSLTE